MKSPTNKIVLNAVDLSVSSAVIKYEGQPDSTASSIDFSTEEETVTFTFPDDLPIGECTLDLVFKGNLNDKMKGFYRSKYYTPTGEERYGAVTQL